jgi:hypothetical protein
VTTRGGVYFNITTEPGLGHPGRRGGTRFPDVELGVGATKNWQWTVSADRRHAFVLEWTTKAGPVSIFDLETGALVGRADVGRLPVGSILVGKKLVMGFGVAGVFDLDAQKMIWTRAVRSLGYNGPYPPSARR